MRILIILLSILCIANAEQITGTVVGIKDGDTLVLLVDKKEAVIRLAEIDAPESKQPFGERAKQALSDLCFKKSAVADIQTTDRYKRKVARVYCDDVDVNAELIKIGMAWVYDQYVTDLSLYDLQLQAKSDNKGLWGGSEKPIQPCNWRKQPKANKDKVVTQEFDCGVRKTCKQMKSCAEAQFYLNQCGISRLDRDGDGVPCESICR